MFNKYIKLNLALFAMFFMFVQSNAFANTESVDSESIIEISAIDIQTVGDATNVLIRTNGKIESYDSKVIEGSDSAPARMYIDIDKAKIADIKKDYSVGTELEKIRVSPNNDGIRILFDAKGKAIFGYNIELTDNGVSVSINKATIAESQPEEVPNELETSNKVVSDDTLDQLIESSVAEVENQPLDTDETTPTSKDAADGFSMSGFKKDRISVDFYKIDLHNVFRLFREVSGLNIIVDDKVKGSLTLSLNDVPWDFALDIILNLSDLKKEERFNTIVIYPNSQEFSWPERSSLDNLEIETDLDILAQETLIVSTQQNQPKEVMLAQESLKKAKSKEKSDDYEDAVVLYEEAFELWPANSKIADKLATLFLVNLRMNAKAVHYAKESLKLNPDNSGAALYAAIGLANMQNKPEAIEYFNQSVSGNPPMKEALISFAAFSENQNDFHAALTLLEKYSDYYGETLDTMLSKARILDKQGDTAKANSQFSALLSSGYQLRPDLKKYIQQRLATGNM